MNKLSVLVLSSIFATAAFAEEHREDAPRSASPKARAATAANNNAKPPGNDASTKQREAQMQGNPQSQATAEGKHNAKPHGLNALKSIPLENGSTVYVFKDGKMGMEDKQGRSTRMKAGHVMNAKDGTRLVMIGDEVMRVESLLTEKKGGAN